MIIESFNLKAVTLGHLSIARLDLNDRFVSGNKMYKIRPWIDRAVDSNCGLLSCGGAWSNHLYALAAAGQQKGVRTAALVRGLETHKLTPTLVDCQRWGMQLITVSREDYQRRYEPDFAQSYLADLDFPAVWVPEGGTGPEAVSACEDIGKALNQRLSQGYAFDALWLAVGSGGTLAGISRSLDRRVQIFAVPVMGHFEDIKWRVAQLASGAADRIHWVGDAAFGGFGRANQRHQHFLRLLDEQSAVPFDPVYTSKVLHRLILARQAGEYTGQQPLLLHSGGLQGCRSRI